MFRWKRWIWGFTLDSRHYIMHPWSLDRLNEEMKYMLKQSKVCQEVFWTPFGRGKDQLLNFRVHAPIPGNNFYEKILLIMIVLRTWWRITWRYYTNRSFLRTSQKSTFCIETYCSVYEAILSSTWKAFDKAHVSHTATTESDDVVKLLKKTVLIIDKLNVACLYEQRLNCTKKARSILCDIEVKLQNNTSLAEQL